MSSGNVKALSVKPVPQNIIRKKKRPETLWSQHRRYLKSQGYTYSKYPLNDLVAGTYIYAGHRVVLYRSGFYYGRKVAMSIEELND